MKIIKLIIREFLIFLGIIKEEEMSSVSKEKTMYKKEKVNE